jgi:L-ribulose-5-phosphate 3-epimerase
VRRAIISDQVNMDFEEALHRIRKHFEYVEIHSLWDKTVEDLDDDEAREVETLLKRYGVKVSCLSTTLFLMCPLYTSVETLRRFSDAFLVFTGDVNAHTERLRRCIELSDRFGTTHIRIFPFRTEEGMDVDFSTCISDMKETLSVGVSLAEKDGKLLCLENCPHSYLPRGNMTFELVRSINSENIALLYDPGNSFRAPTSQIPERFRQATLRDEYEHIKELVGYFHFKDYRKTEDGFQHVAFGEGDVGFRDLYVLIRRGNDERTLSLEPEVKNEALEESIRNFIALVT